MTGHKIKAIGDTGWQCECGASNALIPDATSYDHLTAVHEEMVLRGEPLPVEPIPSGQGSVK